MTYTVTNLITDAYYASGIVSREFETVTGQQGYVGLQVLNDILSDKTIDKGMIPYYSKYEFFAVAGQEMYFIPNLEELETLTFFINNVRYQMREVDRIKYFGSPRANNINSLPFNWHLERCIGGANIYLYFFPQTDYPIEAWGQFRLSSVSLNQDLGNPNTTANLGVATISGAGTLTAGQFVVNSIDLAGTYANLAAFAAYINTGVVPSVTATIQGLGLILNNVASAPITISTLGTQSTVNGITFASFSTTNGPMTQVYPNNGFDRFYINYLKFAVAERLCTEYNFIVPPGVQKQLQQYEAWIQKRSGPLDLTTQKLSTLRSDLSQDYGQVNLGKGWSI